MMLTKYHNSNQIFTILTKFYNVDQLQHNSDNVDNADNADNEDNADNADNAHNAHNAENADNADSLYITDNLDKDFTIGTFSTIKPFFQ